MTNKFPFALMYFSFIIYSLSGIFSKIASEKVFLSIPYIFCFCGVFIVLCIYALIWQQVLKQIPLSIAMSNKPICLVFSLIWAFIFFNERFSLKLLIGIILIILGIVVISFYRSVDNELKKENIEQENA